MLVVRMTRIEGATEDGLLTRPVYFQVPSTDDVTIAREGDWADYDGLGGQFSQPGRKARLRTVELRTMTIFAVLPPSWTVNANPALEIAGSLELLLETLSPFRLLLYFLGGPGTFLNMGTTIRSLGKTTKFGEVDTIYYDVGMTEWRRPLVQTRSTGASRAPGSVKLPTTHRLRAGDTFESLSNYYYGNPSGARSIAAANGISNWGLRTSLTERAGLKVGSMLKIPKVSTGDVFQQGSGRAA